MITSHEAFLGSVVGLLPLTCVRVALGFRFNVWTDLPTQTAYDLGPGLQHQDSLPSCVPS